MKNNEKFMVEQDICDDIQIMLVEPVKIDMDTPVSMQEYDMAVDSLTELLEKKNKYISMLQRENMRLKQAMRKHSVITTIYPFNQQ